ncbi:MAG: DUF2442 domain-containing protein [Phycisphaeraceae bacterium]
MASVTETRAAHAVKAVVTDDTLSVWLDDGRTITTPLAWYPRLMHATEAERQRFRIIGDGQGLHWPDLDEDLSVAGMLAGQPSGEGPESLAKWLAARRQR